MSNVARYPDSDRQETSVSRDKSSRGPIGVGQFGLVYRAVDEESGNPFAIKVIDLRRSINQDYARKAAKREIKLLQSFRHVNLHMHPE
jgi:serine/threonine protein kinase